MSNDPADPSTPEIELPRRQRRVLAWISGIASLAVALYLIFVENEIIGGPIIGLVLFPILYAIGDFLLTWRMGMHQRGERLGLRHFREPIREVLVGMLVLPVFFIVLVAAVWVLNVVGLDARAEWLKYLLIFMAMGALFAICGRFGISIVALFFALPVWGLIGYLAYVLFAPVIMRFAEPLFG